MPSGLGSRLPKRDLFAHEDLKSHATTTRAEALGRKNDGSLNCQAALKPFWFAGSQGVIHFYKAVPLDYLGHSRLHNEDICEESTSWTKMGDLNERMENVSSLKKCQDIYLLTLFMANGFRGNFWTKGP